jgi:hypothetical protein
VKIEKRNKSLEDFLQELDLENLEKDMLFSDLDDDEPSGGIMEKKERSEEQKERFDNGVIDQ